MAVNLIHLLQRRVAQTPEAIALLDTQQQPPQLTKSRHLQQATSLAKGSRGTVNSTAYSFADLQRASQRLAGYFSHHCQLQPGDGVLLLQPLSAELYITLAAIWQVGAIAVILNPLLGQRYVAHCARVVKLQVWLAPAGLLATQLLSPALRRIPYQIALGVPLPGVTSWQQVQRHAPEFHTSALEAKSPALLSFTSGTTGLPKPIVRSHALLLAQYHALASVLRWQPGVQELTTLPLFGLANLVAGGITVLPPVNVRRPAQVSGAKLRAAIAQHQIERIVAAPGILGRLLQGAKKSLPSLRQAFIGGAPVTQKLRDRLQSLAPNLQITVVYGATEAEPIAFIPPSPQPSKQPPTHSPNISQLLTASPPSPRRAGGIPGSALNLQTAQQTPSRTPLGLRVGKTVEALELRLFNPETQRPTPPGQPGEILVRGPHVLQSPEPHHRLIHQGQQWHRTGDWGYLDAQAQLWLLGRATAAIRDDRGTIYPLAVEAVANELPGVARSALVSWRGQRVLLVEWEHHKFRIPHSTFRTLIAWAQLDHIVPWRTIPTDRRHNAKVNHAQLQRWLQSPWGQAWLRFRTQTGGRD